MNKIQIIQILQLKLLFFSYPALVITCPQPQVMFNMLISHVGKRGIFTKYYNILIWATDLEESDVLSTVVLVDVTVELDNDIGISSISRYLHPTPTRKTNIKTAH